MPDKKQNRAVIEVDEQLLGDISDLIKSKSDTLLKNILADIYPADIALIIDDLTQEEGIELFKLLDYETQAEAILELGDFQKENILNSLLPDEITGIVSKMDSDDATDVVGMLDNEKALEVLERMTAEDSSEVKELLVYDESTAGGIMQKEFVTVNATDSVNKAVDIIREKAPDNEHLYHVWVTDEEGKLAGIVSLKKIIVALDTPAMIMADIMSIEVISVDVNTDQEEVANIMRKYDLVTLPVVDSSERVVGKISFDDVADIMEEEFSEDVAKIVGSDAMELESKSPFQIAWLRLPWVLITLGIQFFAGVVINYYDQTLTKVILLASFMPIISAISGNTGLQASAMTVRALATGTVTLGKWAEPVKRSLKISLIIGSICGIIIGLIGGLWYGKLIFGLVVGISMCISINISAFVGTTTPLLSKRIGFDPAITVGPFETAFQDVVGITVFLTLATFSLKWLL
ncbi:MAG: magnesium transporter [Chlorobi bacterium]|nr:magnesium transporter [Chlorobiota bacterium]MCI0715658.1 magnesium transporter [Chlorobiota bacterium]